MASSMGYVEYAVEQCSGVGEITFKKMFGEYGLYCNGKLFGTVEGDQLYVKITDAGRAFAPELEIAEPHKGARYFLIDRIEDREFLTELLRVTCAALPEKKAKR